uniref:Uncharacterized protein n=1 Tax=Timema tahoe TaxID=61484 RepID=A0A7R9IKN4_9NEOP|nr:unnamed protein product [Timema tahoe]
MLQPCTVKMPIFSDLGLYYGGSPPPTFTYITPRYNPFPGPPSSHRLPPHSRINKYLPLLPTISESSPLYRRAIPLSRLSSPRPILSLPPYQPPRPIRINTADIDVSTPRRAHRTPNNGDRPGTIKRDRTVVRLQTKRARDQKKKTPGEKLMEKFLIRDKVKVVDTEYKKKVLEAVEVEKKRVESIRTSDRDVPVLSQVEVLDRLLVEEQQKVDEEECAASRRGSDAMLQPISDYKMDLKGEIRLQTVKKKKHKKSKSCDLEPTLEIVESKDVPEKNMLQRRNTVKKIRRMSEDILLGLDTNKFIPSSKNDTQIMSSVEENIQLSSIKCKPSCNGDTVKTNTTGISLIPVTGETSPAEKNNKPKKGVKGVKNKISIEVSIENDVGAKQFKNKILPKFTVDDIRVEETLISKRKLAQKIHYEVVVEDFLESVDKTEKSKTTNKESNLTVNDPTQLVDKVNKSLTNKVSKITKNDIKNSKTEKDTTAKVLVKEKQNSNFSAKENSNNFLKSEEEIVWAKDKVTYDNLAHISIKKNQELKRVKSIQEQKMSFENRSERESTFSNKETKSMSSIISSLNETVIEKDKVILKSEIIIPNSFNSKPNSGTKEHDVIKGDEQLFEHPNTQERPTSSAQRTSSCEVNDNVEDTQLFEPPTNSNVETFQIDTAEKDILNKIIQKTCEQHMKRNEKKLFGNINKIFIKNDSQNGKSCQSEALCTTAPKGFVSKSRESKKRNTEKSTIDITAHTETLPPPQEASIDFWAVLNTSASGTRLNEAYKSIKIINKRAKVHDKDMDISRINEEKVGEELTSMPTPIGDGKKRVPNMQSNIEVEHISELEVKQFKFNAEVECKKHNFQGKEKKTKLDKKLANNFDPKSVVGINKAKNTKQPREDTFGKNNFKMKGEEPQQNIRSTIPLNGKEKEELGNKLETKVEGTNVADKMKQPHLDMVVVNSKIDNNDFFSQISIEAILKPDTMKLQTKEQKSKTTTDHKNNCLGSTNKGLLDSKYETQYSADENCYINPINQSLKSLGEPFREESSVILNVMESKVDSSRLDINDSMKLSNAITNKKLDIFKCSSTVKKELSHQNVVDPTAKPVQNNLTTSINDDISKLLIGPTEKVDDGDTSSKQSDFIQPGTPGLKKSGNIEKVEQLKIFSPPNNNNLPEDKNSLHTNILLSKNLVKNKKIDNILNKINKNIPKDKIIKETEPTTNIKAKISKTKKSMKKKEQISSMQKPIEVGTNNSVAVNIKNVEEVHTSNKTSVKLDKQPDTKEKQFPAVSKSSPKKTEVFEESTPVNLHPDPSLVPSVAPTDNLPPNEHTASNIIVGTSPEESNGNVIVTPPPRLEDSEEEEEEEETETETDDDEEVEVSCDWLSEMVDDLWSHLQRFRLRMVAT